MILTVALSLGLASAAGYIPGGDQLAFLAPVQDIMVTHGLAKGQPQTARPGKAQGDSGTENVGNGNGAGKSPGSGCPEELGPPPRRLSSPASCRA